MNATEILSSIPEIFGLIIRITGLALAVSKINDILQALIMMLGGIFIRSFVDLLFCIPVFLLGIWFLRGAPWLMSFSYPQN